MTEEEKLRRFQQISMEDAEAACRKRISEAEAQREERLRQHRAAQKRDHQLRYEREKEDMLREIRQEAVKRQLQRKRRLADAEETYRDRLFSEAAERLFAFRRTEAYLALLRRQIEEIQKLSAGEVCEIYLDREDRALLPLLPGGVRLSDEPLLGGTVGKIPSGNMRIDYSFRNALLKEKRAFQPALWETGK